MSIGSRIKELRIKRGLTQEELARQIGVTKGAVANYENEVSSPKIELMYKLFDVLQCDANYLHQDDMKSNVYRDSSTPEEFENIIKKYRALDEHGKDMVDMVLEKESERMDQLQQAAAPAPAADAPITFPDHLTVNAAHARNDVEATDEMQQHDEDIMDDENF